MTTLLPTLTQQKMKHLYRMRLLLVASLFLIGVGLVAGSMLLPSYLILERSASSLGPDPTSTSSALAANTSDHALIAHVQSRMDELAPLVASTSTPSGAILAALAPRPSGVSVDHISYSSGKTYTLLVSGSSKTGNQVNAYQQALAASNRFSGVSVPVGALAGVDNGRFNITIIGTF